MSYFNVPVTPRAVKQHTCTFCAGKIPVGTEYVLQTGVYEFEWFRNKYHQECWRELLDSGEMEFIPGDGEVPYPYKEIE